MRTGLSTDCRKAHRDWAFLALLREDVGGGQAGYGVGALEETVRPTTLCVNHPLRDPLSVEVGEQVNEVEVLQKKRAVLADSLSLIWVRHRSSVGSSIEGVFGSYSAVLLICRELGGDMPCETGIC